MKKRKATRLSLSRETLRSQADSNLGEAGGTKVVSDCYACTGRLDTCPDPTVVAV